MSQPKISLPDPQAVSLPHMPEPPITLDALHAVTPSDVAPFTAHVFACLFCVALLEMTEEDISLDEALGLGSSSLQAIAAQWAPHPRVIAAATTANATCKPYEEEEQVLALLLSHATDASPETKALCAMIARRAMRPNHLWQDLGLNDRGELNRLLRERVPTLHARNTQDMKWKKFFYRSLCELEGFTLCTAPSCRECCDFDRCFGTEDGESRLARTRLATETLSQM